MTQSRLVGVRCVLVFRPELLDLIPAGARVKFKERPGKALEVYIRQNGEFGKFWVAKKEGGAALMPWGRNIQR